MSVIKIESSEDFDLTEFIRSLQRIHGYSDCFRRATEYCDQFDCAWRQYCIEDPKKNFET